MFDLHDILKAGRVRRWHCNPDLSWTDDYIDGHGARVTKILMSLCPCPSKNLLICALTHDDGEHAVGDLAQPIKAANPAIAQAAAEIEADVLVQMWPMAEGARLSDIERDWLHLADRIDAYWWAGTHRPSVLSRLDWQESRRHLVEAAMRLDCLEAVRVLLNKLDGRL